MDDDNDIGHDEASDEVRRDEAAEVGRAIEDEEAREEVRCDEAAEVRREIEAEE